MMVAVGALLTGMTNMASMLSPIKAMVALSMPHPCAYRVLSLHIWTMYTRASIRFQDALRMLPNPVMERRAPDHQTITSDDNQ